MEILISNFLAIESQSDLCWKGLQGSSSNPPAIGQLLVMVLVHQDFFGYLDSQKLGLNKMVSLNHFKIVLISAEAVF